MNSDLIKKPFFAEKSGILSESGKYVFMVDKNSTKNEVKKAIKALYKVDAVQVNIINQSSKPKKFRNIKSESSGFKKAIVTVKKGQKIDLVK